MKTRPAFFLFAVTAILGLAAAASIPPLQAASGGRIRRVDPASPAGQQNQIEYRAGKGNRTVHSASLSILYQRLGAPDAVHCRGHDAAGVARPLAAGIQPSNTDRAAAPVPLDAHRRG